MTTHGAHVRRDPPPVTGPPRRDEPRPRRRRSPLVLAAGLVFLLVVLSFATFAALHSRLFSATTVVVTGEHHESARQIERAAGLTAAPPLISIDTAAMELRIEATFPWIATAVVSKSWPHTVHVRVVERAPVAIVDGTHGTSELVDGTGRRLGPARPSQTLPRIEYTAAGATTPPDQVSGAAEPGLLVAATLPRAFAWQVAVIQVSSVGWVSLHLDSPITFILGPASNLGAKYEDIAAVIARTTLHAGDVVDVSVPQAMTVTGP